MGIKLPVGNCLFQCFGAFEGNFKIFKLTYLFKLFWKICVCIVHVSVCVHLCMCMYAYMFVCIYACTCICLYMCYVWECRHVCTYVCLHGACVFTYVSVGRYKLQHKNKSQRTTSSVGSCLHLV